MAKMRQLKIVKQVTPREDKALDKYLTEIGRYPLVKWEEEVLLAQRIKAGDVLAHEKLVKANLRFVVSVAKQYQNRGLSITDLISEGNFGLAKAAWRFDETRGFKFISYAVWWIRQSILQALSDHSRIVRLPTNQIQTSTKMLESSAAFEQVNERLPSDEELAELLDVDPEKVTYIWMNTRKDHVRIDNPSMEGSSEKISDMMESEHRSDSLVVSEDLKKVIRNSLNKLSAREAKIVSLYFGLEGNRPQDLEDIGGHLDLTRERVRQIKKVALRKLGHMNNGQLRQHLN